MFKLIRFYFKTYFKSYKNYIPIAVIAFAIIGYCVLFNVQRAEPGKSPNFLGITIGFSDEEKDKKSELLIKQIEEAQSQENWPECYKKTIEYNEFLLQNNHGREDDSIQMEIERYKYLLKENLSFEEEALTNNGLSFIRTLINEPVVLLILVAVLLGSAQLFSSEVQNKTYKLLYTQSMSKNKIFFSKLLSTILINFTIVFSLIFICFVYQSLVKGMGSPKFLIKAVLSIKEEIPLGETWPNIRSYITIGRYVFIELGFLALMMIFTCCLGTTISLLINNSAASISGSAVILGFLYVLFKKDSFAAIQKYNPGAYLDVDRIMSMAPDSGLNIIASKSFAEREADTLAGKIKPLINLSINSGMILFFVGIIALISLNLFIINKKTIAK